MIKFCAAAFLLMVSFFSTAEELIIGITPANGAPYVVGDFNPINNGIIYDISQQLTKVTGITFRFTVLPRARIEPSLQDGRIDVVTFFNPNWTQKGDHYVFSEPTFTEGNIIVSRLDDEFQPNQWTDLYGHAIGGHLGYVYPQAFNEAVEQGLLFRDNANTPGQNYLKLQANRIRGFILSDIIYAYDVKENKDLTANTKASEWRIAVNPIHWVMLKNHPDSATIIEALNELIDSGTVAQILEQYR